MFYFPRQFAINSLNGKHNSLKGTEKPERNYSCSARSALSRAQKQNFVDFCVIYCKILFSLGPRSLF